MKVILAIDLGTTGNRAIAFSKEGKVVAKSYYEFPQIFPQPGWVEHDPLNIWNTTRRAVKDVLAEVGPENVATIGITNQRETTILWIRNTGKPVYNAIVWQCRRTKKECEALAPQAAKIRRKTGLFVDPYFSATKIRWIIDNVKGVRAGIERGEIIFGTVDSWVLWNLTGGKVHASEPSNAARTMCFNIHTLRYDPELLKLYGLPLSIFPEVKESGTLFGVTDRGGPCVVDHLRRALRHHNVVGARHDERGGARGDAIDVGDLPRAGWRSSWETIANPSAIEPPGEFT
jgi:glycerol kinase